MRSVSGTVQRRINRPASSTEIEVRQADDACVADRGISTATIGEAVRIPLSAISNAH